VCQNTSANDGVTWTGSELLHPSSTERHATIAAGAAQFPWALAYTALHARVREGKRDSSSFYTSAASSLLPWKHLGVQCILVQSHNGDAEVRHILYRTTADTATKTATSLALHRLQLQLGIVMAAPAGQVHLEHVRSPDRRAWPLLVASVWFWYAGHQLVLQLWFPQLVLAIVGGGIDGVMHALLAARSAIIAQIYLFEALPQLMAATSAMCFRNHGGLEYANATDLRSVRLLQKAQAAQRHFFTPMVHKQVFGGGYTTFQGTVVANRDRNICEHLMRSQQLIDSHQLSSRKMEYGELGNGIQCRLQNLTTEPHFSKPALLRHFWNVVHHRAASATPFVPRMNVIVNTQVVQLTDRFDGSLLLKVVRGTGATGAGAGSPAPETFAADFVIQSIGAFEFPLKDIVSSPRRPTTPTPPPTYRYIRAMVRFETINQSACISVGSSFTLLGETGSMLEIVPSIMASSPSSTLMLFIPKQGYGYVKGSQRGEDGGRTTNASISSPQSSPSPPVVDAASFAHQFWKEDASHDGDGNGNGGGSSGEAQVEQYTMRYLTEIARRHACVNQDILQGNVKRAVLLMAPLASCDSVDVAYQRLLCPVQRVPQRRILVTNSAKCTHAILTAQHAQHYLSQLVKPF